MTSTKVMLIGFDGANPALLRSYVEQGALPNIGRLMERGVFSVAMPAVPANTPVNWTGIATGANPGTHGIADYWVHYPGQPLDKYDEVFRSDRVHAEQVWNTADRAGKRALVINYPCAYPPALTHGIFVGGEGAPESGSVFELKSPCCFVTEAAVPGTKRATVIRFSGAEPAARIALVPSKGADPRGVEYEVRLLAGSAGYDRAKIRDSSGQVLACLWPGEWSEWLADRFVVDGRPRTGRFRFYLTQLSPDGQLFKLYTSQIFPEGGFSMPEGISAELVEAIGPCQEYCGAGPFRRGWTGVRAWFDEMRYQSQWMARAGSYLMTKYECDLYYSHCHMLDHVFHYLWGGFDPLTGWYDPARSAEYEAWMLEAHQIVDDAVGIYLEHVPEDTTFIVVSDHGLIPHIKAVSINNVLAQAGLIACRPGTGSRPVVDWGKTAAYKPTDAAHIWINLAGRDPQGVVTPGAEYEAVQERIIDALLSLRDPENGKRPVALALKKRDAALLGVWGENAGDVIFLMNDEYSAPLSSPLSSDGRVIVKMGPDEENNANLTSAAYQSYHGCALPTAQIGRGASEAGMFLVAGPGIKQGVQRDRPINLIDVAPTIAHLLGIPQPAQAEGRILFDIME